QTRDSWSRPRRVIAKAEHLEKGANPRFVVTSLSPQETIFPTPPRWGAQSLYEEFYCARGDMENRIKEQMMLFADRTSTSWMKSNQIRLYFSTVAYLLMQSLRRLGLAGTELAKAQCHTVRLKLLKIGAQIRITVRKIWVSLSTGYPYLELFRQVYRQLQVAALRCLKEGSSQTNLGTPADLGSALSCPDKKSIHSGRGRRANPQEKARTMISGC